MERRPRGEANITIHFYLAGINKFQKFLMLRFVPGFIFLLVFVPACTNNTIGNRKNINPDAVFFEYIIRGDEDDSNVTLYLQFRTGGPNGYTLTLKDPAKVEVDGEIVPVDSARLTGAYYEIQKPAESFVGKHTITFTDFNKKVYSQEFEYKPFSLATELGDVSRGDLVFELEGLEKEDYLHVSATDTSFTSRDIIEIDTVINGKLIIPAGKLKHLVDGPITLLLSKETQKIIRDEIRGRITVSYGLKREFELGQAP
jgi:hypothetical protein